MTIYCRKRQLKNNLLKMEKLIFNFLLVFNSFEHVWPMWTVNWALIERTTRPLSKRVVNEKPTKQWHWSVKCSTNQMLDQLKAIGAAASPVLTCRVMQRQTAVTAYFTCKQLLLFAFALQCCPAKQTAVTVYLQSGKLILFAVALECGRRSR